MIHIFQQEATAWHVEKQLESRKIVRDIIQFIVNGLQDKTGAAVSMLYCTSLKELREKLIIFDQIRQKPQGGVGRVDGSSIGKPEPKAVLVN